MNAGWDATTDCLYSATLTTACDHDSCQSNRKASTVTLPRTATILAEMRADLTATILAENDPETVEAVETLRARRVKAVQSGRTISGERYGLASAAGRKFATTGAQTFMQRSKGTDDTFILDRNNIKRDCSLPARAFSMANVKGTLNEDTAAYLTAWWQNPGNLSHTLLVSFLPQKVSLVEAKRIVADHAAAEGWGDSATAALLADLPAVLRTMNPGSGRSGRAAHRLLIADGVTAPTVDPKRRGRPSGPKFVEYLCTPQMAHAASLLLTGARPSYGPNLTHGIPHATADGEMAGAGHDQGAGWEDAKPEHRTPAQVRAMQTAYTASASGYRSIDGVIVERW